MKFDEVKRVWNEGAEDARHTFLHNEYGRGPMNFQQNSTFYTHMGKWPLNRQRSPLSYKTKQKQ